MDSRSQGKSVLFLGRQFVINLNIKIIPNKI